MHCKSVLVVDDYQAVRKALRAVLMANGCDEVLEAENGWAAVQLAKEHSPDVILMDLSMPSLNGLEATRMIRRSDPAAKILILSGHTDQAQVDHALSAGAVGYLVKDGAAQELVNAIRAL